MRNKIKLLIHVGYPKTGTTTLQDGLFIHLHEKNLINYCGLTSKERGFGQFRKYEKLRTYLYNNTAFSFDELNLSNKKINVVSDEILTVPFNFRKKHRKNIINDCIIFPYKFQEISKDYDVRFLFTIRNQADLIFSLYSQIYPKLLEGKYNQDSPNKLFFDDEMNFKSEIFKVYDFYYLINKYEECFGFDNIHIALFEDFENNRQNYFKVIADSLNLNINLIEEEFPNIHLRNKKVNDESKFEPAYEKKMLLKLYLWVMNRYGSIKYLRYLDNFLRKKNVLDKENTLLYKCKHVEVPRLTSENIYTIRQHFNKSNLLLCNKFNLNLSLFAEYKYIEESNALNSSLLFTQPSNLQAKCIIDEDIELSID